MKKRIKVELVIAVILSVMISMALSGCGHHSYFEEFGGSSVETETGEEAPKDSGKKSEKSADSVSQKQIFVQVAGAVKRPGVYELEPDSRVFAVIEKAGGLARDADDSDLNQAQALEDGQKIYIYKKGERSGKEAVDTSAGTENASSVPAEGKVNINTADAAELMTLSGIGESKAAAIVSYRESNGAFAKAEDIMNVDGIAEGTFGKIKDQITV